MTTSASESMSSVSEEQDDGEKIDAAEAFKQEQKACEEETRAAEKAKLDAKLKGASDYYELLDVTRDATRVQIKKANMKLLKKCVRIDLAECARSQLLCSSHFSRTKPCNTRQSTAPPGIIQISRTIRMLR